MMYFLTVLLFLNSHSMEKKTLLFSSGQKIQIEVASTAEEKAKGLMYRKSLPNNSGMLFIFPYEQKLTFWMKNTYIPLTIGFFDSKMKLLETVDMQPHLGPVSDEKLPHYESQQAAKYALEMQMGWFAKNKINPGVTFSLQ